MDDSNAALDLKLKSPRNVEARIVRTLNLFKDVTILPRFATTKRARIS